MKKIMVFLTAATFFLNACRSDTIRYLTPSVPVATKTSTSPIQISDTPIFPVHNTTEKNNCISPIVVSGFDIGETASTPIPQQNVLPFGWDSVSKTPGEFKGEHAYINLMRSRTSYDEIWVGVRASNELTDVNNRYLIYRTDTKEWREAPHLPGFNLFLDKDHNVWSFVNPLSNTASRFYRLDENTNQFVSVTDKTNELGKATSNRISSWEGMDYFGLFFVIRMTQQQHTKSCIVLIP